MTERHLISDGKTARCANCGRLIAWQFDRDDADRPVSPYGLWYDADRETEACGGPDPETAVDEDLWHEPLNEPDWDAYIAAQGLKDSAALAELEKARAGHNLKSMAAKFP